MTRKEEYVAAVDIGTTKIVSMVGKRDQAGKVEVIAMSKTESNGVRRGMVLNVEETSRNIEKAMSDVMKKTDMSFSEVFVGIAAQHIRCLKSRHFVDRADADVLISEEDVKRLHEDVSRMAVDPRDQIVCIIPQHYIVDGEPDIRNPVGMTGKRLEANFNIVLCHKNSATNITRCMQRLNINVSRLLLEPLASSDAVLTDEEREAGVVLVDIGGGTTDIAVFLEGELKHTAVIPFGGFSVTKDIKEGCGILQKQAENLKIKYGSAFGSTADENKVVVINGIGGREQKEVSFRALASIIQARMEEIIEEVMFEIESSGVYDRLHAGIVLTGGGALLKDLPQLVRFRTGLDVKVSSPCNYVSEKCAEELDHPMFATSIGLLIQGFSYIDDCNSPDAIDPENNIRKTQDEILKNIQSEPVSVVNTSDSKNKENKKDSGNSEGKNENSDSKKKGHILGISIKDWQTYISTLLDDDRNEKKFDE